MIRLLLLLGLAAAVASEATAQRHMFEAGYIVLATGDTLRGEVAALPELQATRQVLFRHGPQREVLTFSPSRVIGYGTDAGRRYVQRTVQPEGHRPAETLFLLQLAEGPPHLYAFAIEQLEEERAERARHRAPYLARRYAIERADGTVLPLYIRYRFDPAVDQDVVTDRQYLRVLADLFQGCPAAEAHLPQLRFRTRPLIAALDAYASCLGTELVATAPRAAQRRADVRFEVGLSLASGMRTLSAADGTNGRAGMAYSAGFVTAVRPLILSRNLSVPLELTVGYITARSEAAAKPFSAEDFSRARAALHAGLRYEVPAGRFAPFAGAGVISAHLLGDTPRRQLISFEAVTFPTWEAGYYLELGAIGPSPLPLSRRAVVGIRYERLGLGEPNPLAISDGRWRSSTLGGFLSISF